MPCARSHRDPHCPLLSCVLAAVLLFSVLGLATTAAFAQAVPDAENTPAAPESPAEPPAPANSPPDTPPTFPDGKLIETPPPPTAMQRLDSVFKVAVSAMEKVLFYPIGQSERSYILYEPQSVFVRNRDSDGDFFKLRPGDDYRENELSPSDLQLLAAQGLLLPGHVVNGVQQDYRLGQIDGRNVDYVTIKRDDKSSAEYQYGDKFVLEPKTGKYRKLGRKRGLPTETLISPAQVERWQAAGDLRPATTPRNGAVVALHTESVGGIPVVVLWLAAGAIYFTIFFRFLNFWGVKHSVQVIRGKYDNPKERGEVSHFQALSSALSGTIGLGNIAGVTIAMAAGGPGAFFWMLMSGLFGMASKFVECTLGVKYRKINPDGTVLGGPMRYLSVGLKELGLGPIGVVLAVAFSIMCILGSFGGGNMLQANQAGSATLQMLQEDQLKQLSDWNEEIKAAAAAADVDRMRELQAQRSALTEELSRFEQRFKIGYGIVMAIAVAVVIIGGIRRIGAAAEKIVPTMCVVYMLACLYIICSHLDRVPAMVSLIFTDAFTGKAMAGGLLGVLVMGVRRAAFSNEAGAGSAAIAHSAARTEEPVREGCVALLEPFIDTIVVCSMTALVILLTGAWDNDRWVVDQGLQGAALTSRAFREEIVWFPKVLSVAVTLFAYSTIISWSYYGERAWVFLLGNRSTFVYKILAVICVFVGSVVNLGSVLDFSDMMILGMAFPNILGLLLLAPGVRRDLARYWTRYKAGDFPTYR